MSGSEVKGESGLVVLVGKGIGGQEELLRAIRELGVEAESAGECVWPRDDYIYNGSRNPPYLKSYADGEYNPLGEGGNFQFGKDFALVSDFALTQEFAFFKKDLNLIYKKSISAFEEAFPATRLHVAPTNYQYGPLIGCEHVDLFALLFPKSKLLVLDTSYGKAANHPSYVEIAEKEELKLIKYDGANDEAILPVNGFVLPTENRTDTVLLDSKSSGLINLLKDNGVNAVGVPMPYEKEAWGKIGCQLNFYYKSDGVKPQELLNSM